MEFKDTLDFARSSDEHSPIKKYRNEFAFPTDANGMKYLYFAGHSLGLMPNSVRDAISAELDDWQKYGVEGHFHAKNPWMPYHEILTDKLAKLVGAKPLEVVAMNTLTVNLHLMMVSFYRPTKSRFKILIENNTFPSDKYAVDSQASFHGFDPKEAIIELKPEPGKMTVEPKKILETIEEHKNELALVMLGNCNYLSGQYFDIPSITKKGHEVGAMVGFNLAHGAGNLNLKLHDWNVDFAVWCSYKYLNSGPGGLAGCFVHENHSQKNLPRFAGWWGHDKATRFKMGPHFQPIPGAEGWQLSNPPIFQLAAMNASLELFDEIGMDKLRECGDQLTSYLEYLFLQKCADAVEVITPKQRGSMLCLAFKKDPKKLNDALKEKGVICDFREPNILRMTPAPMYNSYEDAYNLVEVIAGACHE